MYGRRLGRDSRSEIGDAEVMLDLVRGQSVIVKGHIGDIAVPEVPIIASRPDVQRLGSVRGERGVIDFLPIATGTAPLGIDIEENFGAIIHSDNVPPNSWGHFGSIARERVIIAAAAGMKLPPIIISTMIEL